jgi:hypothetical protein
MQHKITVPSKLLDKHGELLQKGYATSLLLEYRRRDVARQLRLKEWDYYLIYNKNYAVALTVGKSSTLLLISTTLIDLKYRKEVTKSVVRIITKYKFEMPESSEKGDIVYQDKTIKLSFLHRGDIRDLYLYLNGLANESDLEVSIRLFHEPQDSMVIATPFKEDKKAFYYNQKIIGMNATGTVNYKDQTYSFSPDNSFGLLDWGRGVWPSKTTWYWSASQGLVCGNLFGFNLGYGFGDTNAATENMLFFNGIASKLNDVVFHIPRNEKNEFDYMKPWTITSSDQRIEMEFFPIIDRSVNISIVILSTNQHQVFGKFTGSAVLEDGTIIYVKDFMGFAERVENRW